MFAISFHRDLQNSVRELSCDAYSCIGFQLVPGEPLSLAERRREYSRGAHFGLFGIGILGRGISHILRTNYRALVFFCLIRLVYPIVKFIIPVTKWSTLPC